MPAPDAPAPPVPAAWVAAALALAPPRPPATPAAAAALVPKAAALSISRWHAGTNDPDADHEKGAIAPRRFGGPAPPPPPKAIAAGSLGKLITEILGRVAPDVPQGLRAELRPPARAHGPRETCRGLRGSSTRAGRENHYARTASRSNSAPSQPISAAEAAGRARRAARRARTPGRASVIKRPTHPCRRPRLVCPSAARPAAGPAWATPRRSWTWTPWTLILAEIRCYLDQERRRRGPGRTSGRAEPPGKGAVRELGRSGGWSRAIYLTAVSSQTRSGAGGVLRAASSGTAAARSRQLAPGPVAPLRSRRERRGHRAGHRRAGRLRRPAGHRAAAPVAVNPSVPRSQ